MMTRSMKIVTDVVTMLCPVVVNLVVGCKVVLFWLEVAQYFKAAPEHSNILATYRLEFSPWNE